MDKLFDPYGKTLDETTDKLKTVAIDPTQPLSNPYAYASRWKMPMEQIAVEMVQVQRPNNASPHLSIPIPPPITNSFQQKLRAIHIQRANFIQTLGYKVIETWGVDWLLIWITAFSLTLLASIGLNGLLMYLLVLKLVT